MPPPRTLTVLVAAALAGCAAPGPDNPAPGAVPGRADTAQARQLPYRPPPPLPDPGIPVPPPDEDLTETSPAPRPDPAPTAARQTSPAAPERPAQTPAPPIRPTAPQGPAAPDVPAPPLMSPGPGEVCAMGEGYLDPELAALCRETFGQWG